MFEPTGRLPPRNWPALLMFTVTLGIALTLVPSYGLIHGYGSAAWLAFALLLCATELSITCGYHRLFSHATYQAHKFAHDYRNGVRWWHWDPSKWLINALNWVGLAHGMKRTSWFKIRRAMLETQFLATKQALALQAQSGRFDDLRQHVAEEYEIFSASVAAWTSLREQSIATAKQRLRNHLESSTLPRRLKALENALLAQHQRMKLITAQLTIARA
jgi:hypothetical protein